MIRARGMLSNFAHPPLQPSSAGGTTVVPDQLQPTQQRSEAFLQHIRAIPSSKVITYQDSTRNMARQGLPPSAAHILDWVLHPLHPLHAESHPPEQRAALQIAGPAFAARYERQLMETEADTALGGSQDGSEELVLRSKSLAMLLDAPNEEEGDVQKAQTEPSDQEPVGAL
jgi:hypothetical protein